MSPIKDAKGRLIGSSAIFRDINELKRVQEQLRRETHEKDQFLALLSHELRNPLAPLRNGITLLRLQRDPQRLAETQAMMERQVAHMARLIEDTKMKEWFFDRLLAKYGEPDWTFEPGYPLLDRITLYELEMEVMTGKKSSGRMNGWLSCLPNWSGCSV